MSSHREAPEISKDPVADNADAGRGRGPVDVRIPVKAGPRAVGVAFLERNELRDEQVLRPRLRGAGPALAVGTVTISGPYNPKGPGDTPARRRPDRKRRRKWRRRTARKKV